MKEKIREVFVGFVLILASIFSLFGCVGHISQKKKTEKGRSKSYQKTFRHYYKLCGEWNKNDRRKISAQAK